MSLTSTSFLGRWRIERDIEDSLAQSRAHFSGDAEITKGEGVWHYFERGALKLQNAPEMVSERRYIWKPTAGGIDIYFSDNRFFHRLELTERAQAKHWCDPDQYDVAYDFSDWPRWSSRWTVKGPRKAYTMTSLYCPIE